jgi:hypothetical protein
MAAMDVAYNLAILTSSQRIIAASSAGHERVSHIYHTTSTATVLPTWQVLLSLLFPF